MLPGQTFVVEHKTTAADIGQGSPYWRRLTLDSQISNYLEGARAFDLEPDGVLYDVIRKVRLEPYRATPDELREYTKPKDKACPECKRKNALPAPHRIDVTPKADEGAEPGDRIFAECKEGRVVTDPGGKLYANMRERDETPDEYRARIRADITTSPEKYYQRGEVVRLDEEERDSAFDAWAVGKEIRESQKLKRWPRNDAACDSYGSLCSYFDVCTRVANINDPLLFRTAETEHEELGTAAVKVDKSKRSLPLLSTSSARAYRSCPRKYFYAYELRRRRITDAQALRFGTLIHLGLEVWWRTTDLAAAVAAMRAGYAGLEIDPVDAIRAEELMLGYHVRWSNEPLQVLAVEVEFRAPLINPETNAPSQTWDRGGKIDALARVA